jgi:hypothetical protein
MTVTPYHEWIHRTVQQWEDACCTLPLNCGDGALAHIVVFERVLASAYWLSGTEISEEGREAILEGMIHLQDALQNLEESLQELAGEGFWGEEYEEAVQEVIEDCLYELEGSVEALADLADEPEPQPEPEPEDEDEEDEEYEPAPAIPADLAARLAAAGLLAEVRALL